MTKSTVASLIAVAFFSTATLSFAPLANSQSADDAKNAFMEAHQKMMTTMQGMKMSGDADKDFAMMMVPHHQGAIDMAEVELKFGKDPQLQAMAKKIIESQKAEMEEFQKWQTEHSK